MLTLHWRHSLSGQTLLGVQVSVRSVFTVRLSLSDGWIMWTQYVPVCIADYTEQSIESQTEQVTAVG